jgi:hypothetical protein
VKDPRVNDVALRNRFLGWQCRLRQIAVRDQAGRPNAGMMPRLLISADAAVPESIVVLIVESESAQMTAQLQHIYRSNRDPRTRYDRALVLLQTGYFQHPERFGDLMTALFAPNAAAAESIARAEQCSLEFDHYNQRYRVPCRIARLDSDDEAWQATYWHNVLFNPRIAADSIVLGFTPDWDAADSQP